MTESITIARREFTVTHDQPTTEDFETPYLLTPKVKRGPQANYRLLRNKPKPHMLFPIGDKPMSAGGSSGSAFSLWAGASVRAIAARISRGIRLKRSITPFTLDSSFI